MEDKLTREQILAINNAMYHLELARKYMDDAMYHLGDMPENEHKKARSAYELICQAQDKY